MMKPLRPKKVLITGYRGHIGSRLVSRILESHPEFSVCGLDLPGGRELESFDSVECDLASEGQLQAISSKLKDIEVLVHLAARIDNSRDLLNDGVDSINQNVLATLNLISLLHRLERIIYASSYIVYGSGCTSEIKEEHTTDPRNLYGTGKLATEKFLGVLAVSKVLPVTILRFAGIYGPGGPLHGNRSIPTFIRSIKAGFCPPLWGDVNAKRNYLYIDDAITALVVAMAGGEDGVYNVAGPDAVSVLDIVDMLQRIFDVHIDLDCSHCSNDQHANFVLDCSRFHSKYGFRPATRFIEGLRQQVQSYNTADLEC